MVSLGERPIAWGTDPFLIAEAGVNHNGDVDTAHELIDVAADARADAVKFQTFEPELVVSAAAAAAPYQRSRGGTSSQLTLLQSLALPDAVWPELARHARERGIVFLSTPFDPNSARLLDDLDVAGFKIGSGELTNIPFLREVAAYGRPMLLSTGMATLDEVQRALDATEAAAGRALFHCVSAYPASVEQANLRAMTTMHDAFGVPVGWSDHTVDAVSSIVAVALGAALLEKHFTLDREQAGPDHAASLDPAGLSAWVSAARATFASLGDGRKVPTTAEAENAKVVRRSWHVRRAVAKGETLDAGSVIALRPEGGLPPWIDPVGRRVSRDLVEGQLLRAQDML